LSISDEASTSTASEEDSGYFKPSLKTSENVPGPAAAIASARGSGDESGEDVCDEEQQEFCKPRGSGAPNHVEDPTAAAACAVGSTIQLSEADCDRLVEAVIDRLKKTRLAENQTPIDCLQDHL